MAYVGSTSYISIRPYGLLAYTHYEFTGSRPRSKHTFEKLGENPQGEGEEKPRGYTGVLSPFAKKKLKKSISLMVAIAQQKEATNFKTGKKFKFKINFITLTLPATQGRLPDKEVKHCLDNWIKRAKRKHSLRSYVWRAERQKNGSIHFHMITDTYIHYEDLRKDWNSVLRPTGLVEQYRVKHASLTLAQYLKMYPPTEKISREKRVLAFKYGCATKWEQPNSTDVHSVQQVQNLTQYFIKYMSKAHKEGEAPIQGKVWDCSSNLKSKDSCTIHMDSANSEAWDQCWNSGFFETLSTDTCAIIFLKEEDWIHLKGTTWETLWHEYLNRIRLAA